MRLLDGDGALDAQRLASNTRYYLVTQRTAMMQEPTCS